MKIVSYNVNGIRAALGKGLLEWIQTSQPDVLCIQETKATPDQFDTNLFETAGYHHFWMPAEKKGYSGVGILCRQQPDQVIAGMGMARYDLEGRVLRADFGDLTVLSTYFPSGTSGDIRQDFKMEFLRDFASYINQLKLVRPQIVISGDFNICHKAIDINHPERHKNSSGFLPEERAWFDSFVEAGWIDSFREFNQKDQQYSWWSYRANSRNKNLGWRIDYHLVSTPLQGKLGGAGILPEVVHSDHCPVWVEIS